MRGGDLSNEIAPGIGIRFERVIKTEEGKLNKSVKSYIQTINRLDVNVYILTTESDRKAAAFCLKWGVPYFRIIPVDSLLEIPSVCNEMDLLTYYDLDKNIVQNVNSRSNGKVEAKLWTSVDLS